MEYPKREIITLEDYTAIPESVRLEVHDGRPVWRGSSPVENGVILTDMISQICGQIQSTNQTLAVLSSEYNVLLASDPTVVLQPDLMIVSDMSRMTPRWYDGAPAAAMEIVAPSFEHRDYHYKMSMYCRYGAKEYWIIDPLREKIAVWTFADAPYPETYTFQETVPSRFWPDIRIDFARIRQHLCSLGLVSDTARSQENQSA